MKQKKQLIGLLAGILLCVVICLLPLEGLSHEGQLCLGLTLMTVVWWAAQVAQSGYVSGIYLMLLCLLKVADTSVIFSGWTGSTIWLVAGAYLIASAVRSSGLGERLSYAFILRFVRGWRSIIVSIFALTLILSLLIPHPWPRAFLIMSVMMVVIRSANIPQKDAVVIGFTVFAASVPVSLIFITGDSTINPLAMSYAEQAVSFVDWLKVMGPPALILSLLTLGLILLLFKPSAPVVLDLDRIREARNQLGPMGEREIRALVWILIAVALWLTNGITGLDIGWITLLVAMLMSLPVVGEVLGVMKDLADQGMIEQIAASFPDVQMPPFSLLLGPSLYGFWVSALAMVPLAGYFWALHTRLSHSVYLMRRLPNRWELARRCLTLPVLAALFFLGLSLALWLLDFSIYWNVTPDRFLPSSLWEALWS